MGRRMVNVSETMTSQVDSTSVHVIRSVETTARIITDLLSELARHVVSIWLPIIAAATFAFQETFELVNAISVS